MLSFTNCSSGWNQNLPVECPWIPWTFSRDSLDFFHGLSGLFFIDSLYFFHALSWLFPWIPRTFSMDSLDFFHVLPGLFPCTPWTFSMYSLDFFHVLPGFLSWTLWTFTMDSLDFFHGFSRKFEQWPKKVWKKSGESRQTGQCPLPKSRETKEDVQGFHIQTGLSPLFGQESQQDGNTRPPFFKARLFL